MTTRTLPENHMAKRKKPPKPDNGLSSPASEDEMDRVEFQAPRLWVEKLDAAAAALNLSRSAYIRMACNRQMKRDEGGGE